MGGLSSYLTIELILLRSRDFRGWWFIRVAAGSAMAIILGIPLLLLTRDFVSAYVSLLGIWYLLSALMLDTSLKAKECGLIELVLQRFGGMYLAVKYAIYLSITVLSSVLTVTSFLVVSLSIGARIRTLIPLLSMCFFGSTLFITITMVLVIGVGGRRVLDSFSYAVGGLLLIMLFTPYLWEDTLTGPAALVAIGGSILTAILMARHFGKADKSKLLNN